MSMTTEQMIEVLQASHQGKRIEYQRKGDAGWIRRDPDNAGFNFRECNYRISTEPEPPKWRPWTLDEVPRGGWVRNKTHGWEYMITAIRPEGLIWICGVWVSLEIAHVDYTQLDGSPCGVKETE